MSALSSHGVIVLLLTFAAGACAKRSTPPKTPAQTRAANELEFRRTMLDRAAFDLQCEPGTVQVKALDDNPSLGAQVGVSCGDRRVVYVWKQIGALNAAWVAETAAISTSANEP